MALSTSNEIYVWGWNNDGQLGLGHKLDQYVPQVTKRCEPHLFEPVRKARFALFSTET